MVIKHPVYCPHCKEQCATQEELMYYVIPLSGFHCSHCGEIAIPYSGPIYKLSPVV